MASIIEFLLQLGFQKHRCIQLSIMQPQQQVVALHISQLGLLKPFSVQREVWLCPTPLAKIMTGGLAAAGPSAEDGFVIVESNYRCVA